MTASADVNALRPVMDLGLFIRVIEQFAARAFANSANKGFWSGVNLTDISVETRLAKIALMHSELGEMTEGVRKPAMDAHCPEFTSEEVELADLLIRAADYAGSRRLRLAEAIVAKMLFNESRPYMHGKAA